MADREAGRLSGRVALELAPDRLQQACRICAEQWHTQKGFIPAAYLLFNGEEFHGVVVVGLIEKVAAAQLGKKMYRCFGETVFVSEAWVALMNEGEHREYVKNIRPNERFEDCQDPKTANPAMMNNPTRREAVVISMNSKEYGAWFAQAMITREPELSLGPWTCVKRTAENELNGMNFFDTPDIGIDLGRARG